MAFKGPADQDLNNVFALNSALLAVLTPDCAWIAAPTELSRRIRALGHDQRDRLARTPLLLLSVGEQDLARWAPVFEGQHRRDLVSEMRQAPAGIAELVSATLAFLWQLARRDPYAARVLSGASIEWCERLAASVLLDVLSFGTQEPGLLTLRLGQQATFWNKLIAAGTSDTREVRLAARVCALQNALTGGMHPARLPQRAAACSIGPVPARRG